METANIKLASVASDVFGVSGRAMLRALIEGEASAEAMADLAKGQLRRKRADLILALDGRMEEHHRFLLAMQLRRLEAAEHDIAALDGTVQRLGGSSRLRQLWAWRGDWIEHTTEPGAEHAVVDRAADLKKQIGASPRPSHLLRFIHSPVDQEIRGTFGN